MALDQYARRVEDHLRKLFEVSPEFTTEGTSPRPGLNLGKKSWQAVVSQILKSPHLCIVPHPPNAIALQDNQPCCLVCLYAADHPGPCRAVPWIISMIYRINRETRVKKDAKRDETSFWQVELGDEEGLMPVQMANAGLKMAEEWFESDKKLLESRLKTEHKQQMDKAAGEMEGKVTLLEAKVAQYASGMANLQQTVAQRIRNLNATHEEAMGALQSQCDRTASHEKAEAELRDSLAESQRKLAESERKLAESSAQHDIALSAYEAKLAALQKTVADSARTTADRSTAATKLHTAFAPSVSTHAGARARTSDVKHAVHVLGAHMCHLPCVFDSLDADDLVEMLHQLGKFPSSLQLRGKKTDMRWILAWLRAAYIYLELRARGVMRLEETGQECRRVLDKIQRHVEQIKVSDEVQGEGGTMSRLDYAVISGLLYGLKDKLARIE